VNPEAFKIIDGKLYLNWNKSSADEFESDSVSSIETADENWEKIIEKN
jgi:hypothetical protein